MARNVLVTGGNSGIGKEMARALAERGDRVVIASRDLAKSRAAADEINRSAPDVAVEAMMVDLARFDAIDLFAEELLHEMPVIDVLILNAGLYTHCGRRLDNGLEAMIGVMHFGHFRLVQNLLDAVIASRDGRIVVSSSLAHKIGRIREASFEDPAAHRMMLGGYAQAKLANLLFTRELARRLRDSDVTVNAFHPGSVTTGIWEELPVVLKRVIGLFLISPERGADTGVWLASARQAHRYSGEYFFKRKVASSSEASRDTALASWLWHASEARMSR